MPLAVGIDVGTSSVKAVALKRTGKGFALRAVAQAEIKRPEFHPDESPQAIAEAPLRALERVTADRTFARQACAFAVSGPRVAPRLFKFPSIPRSEVEQAIRFEAEQIIPFDLSQATMDFVLFEEGMEEGKPVMEGLVVAVHKEEVDKRFVLLKAARFDPVILDVDAMALSNAYIETEGVGQKEVVALVNIGSRFTNLAILHGPRRAFVRDIATGGDMLSRAVSEVYGLDLAQAEKRKREAMYAPLDALDAGGDEFGGEFGVETQVSNADTEIAGGYRSDATDNGFEPLEGDGADEYVLLDDDQTNFESGGTAEDFGGADDTHNAMPAVGASAANFSVLQDALGDLVSEIQDTFKYYVNRRIVPRVDKIRLCGGTSRFPDIAEFFSDQLGMPTTLWNPFARLDVSPVRGKYPPNFLDELGPGMAVALGLAMRQV
jgi:type IV pilus assembly protein PilM